VNKKIQTIALIIWLCEGTKLRRDKRWKNSYSFVVEVTNTNPLVIKIFLDFLRNNIRVANKKIYAQLQIHKGDNKKELESFWSNISGIPLNQFNKTIVRVRGNKPEKTKGTFKIRVYNKNIFLKLDNLLKAELKEFNSGV
jgi:hypothetical protein